MAWLDAAEPGHTTEWLLLHMLVAREADRTRSAEDDEATLLARQNDDGGWGWSSDGPSDALTTGQVLYALDRTGSRAARAALERAVTWPIAAQRADGTWSVPSRLISSEPTERKDCVYTYWGTAWAVIGLGRAID